MGEPAGNPNLLGRRLHVFYEDSDSTDSSDSSNSFDSTSFDSSSEYISSSDDWTKRKRSRKRFLKNSSTKQFCKTKLVPCSQTWTIDKFDTFLSNTSSYCGQYPKAGFSLIAVLLKLCKSNFLLSSYL